MCLNGMPMVRLSNVRCRKVRTHTLVKISNKSKFLIRFRRRSGNIEKKKRDKHFHVSPFFIDLHLLLPNP